MVEIVADKFPAVDHALDAFGTFIRPLVGSAAFAAALGHADPVTASILGLIVGGATTFGVHAAKSGTRVASSATTMGVANPVLSIAEDVAAAGMTLTGLFLPLRWFLSPLALARLGHRRADEASTNPAAGYNRRMNPPTAKKVPTFHTTHNDTRTDDYRWLQDKTDPEVIAYLDAENAYTKEAMAPTEELQKTLYDELLGRIQETDLSVPYPQGAWLYYSRTEEGKQYPIYCRKPLAPQPR